MQPNDDDREVDQDWPDDGLEDEPHTHPPAAHPDDQSVHVPPRHSGQRRPHERKRRSYRPPSELDRD